jgi:hypothetical protein
VNKGSAKHRSHVFAQSVSPPPWRARTCCTRRRRSAGPTAAGCIRRSSSASSSESAAIPGGSGAPVLNRRGFTPEAEAFAMQGLPDNIPITTMLTMHKCPRYGWLDQKSKIDPRNRKINPPAEKKNAEDRYFKILVQNFSGIFRISKRVLDMVLVQVHLASAPPSSIVLLLDNLFKKLNTI